jgi:hypothetical protein
LEPGGGASLALYEPLRAVYEPRDYTRKIIGFDIFEGYPVISDLNGDSKLATVGRCAVSGGHEHHLKGLLDCHELENTMAHIKKI